MSPFPSNMDACMLKSTPGSLFLLEKIIQYVFLLYTDDSKFGQRLMEKMGWEEGKGLGAKETGNVDHITVSLKADNRGNT